MERVHYKMRQRLVSVGDDFWIEADRGGRAFKVDGKALRLRKALDIEDAQGHKLAKTQERKLHVKDAMEVEDAEGDRLAMTRRRSSARSGTAGPSRSRAGPTWSCRGTSSTTSTPSPMGVTTVALDVMTHEGS